MLVGNRKLLEEEGVIIPTHHDAVTGSEMMVAAQGRWLGEIAVADRLRPEAKEAISKFAALRIRTLLLSGDTNAIASSVAAELGISDVQAELLPEEKLARVKTLRAAGRTVAMVGDGVNDAPALMAASIGIAMGSGTDVAKESADVVLISNDLIKLVETFQIARRTRSIIWQNFTGTIVVDTVGIVLAGFGFLSPLLAAFIHVGSELVFLTNSARLLPAADRWRSRLSLGPSLPKPTIPISPTKRTVPRNS